MSDGAKVKVLKGTGLIIDILPPLIATLTQFPVWIEHSAKATVSGMVLLLACLCCMPCINYIKKFIESPSIPIVWLIVFVLLTLLNNIIDQMIVVAFVGVISNTIGTVLFKIGDAIKAREE